MPQHDDRHDDLAGFDIDEPAEPAGAQPDAWDFPVAGDGGDQEFAFDAFDESVPTETHGTATELEAVDSLIEDAEDTNEDDDVELFTVTNPARTVSVSALIDGRVHRIVLSTKVTSMSESDLTDEVLVLADLARLKALGRQHTVLFQGMSEMGMDDTEALRDFLEIGMDLSTPEQAAAAQAETFATRYATDEP